MNTFFVVEKTVIVSTMFFVRYECTDRNTPAGVEVPFTVRETGRSPLGALVGIRMSSIGYDTISPDSTLARACRATGAKIG